MQGRYQGCRRKQQQQPISLHVLLLSSSSSPFCPLHQHESFEHCGVFFKNPREDLYSRWGLGRCFLNIYETLDRGSWVLHCCPRCPLAASVRAPAPNPHYVSLSASHMHTGDRSFKHPLGSHSQELWQLHCKVVTNL